MKDIGGKGKVGLWLIAGRVRVLNPHVRGFTASLGLMLDVGPSATLLSLGVPGFTVGIGWVTKAQRALDAEATERAAEHERLHAEGVEHGHGAEASLPYHDS